jgi:hypothetical protein
VTSFSALDKEKMMALKGVGPKVIERFEQMGYFNLRQLADADCQDILVQGAQLTGSSCWKNSPQARAAINAVIALAATQKSD